MNVLRSTLQTRLQLSALARTPMPTRRQFVTALENMVVPTRASRVNPHRPLAGVPQPVLRALLPQLTQLSLSTSPASTRNAFFEQRRFLSYINSPDVQHLRRLESVANARPHDSRAQSEYLTMLNEAGMEEEVVRRFDSGKFASGGGVHAEVERARSVVGESASVDPMMMPPPPMYGGKGHTPDEPLHVVVNQKTSMLGMLGKLLSIGFTLFLCILILQSMKGSGGGIRGPLESLTGGFNEEQKEVPEVKFEDVKGVDEATEELEHIVDYLKHPDKYTRLGGKIPRGVLLTGPPGTGKTLLARAIAGEAEVPFFYRSASEFEEMLVGLGASRVRKLFEAAKEQAPCIIFIDEIDAIGGKRMKLSSQGVDRQTLNQLLSSMDGFVKSEGVIVLAATNFPESLDGALTRPGRFDVTVAVNLPDVQGRRDILELYFSKTSVDPSIDPMTFARATPGMSGADLEALVNQAALRAAKRGAELVSQEDLDEAKDKLTLGPARKSKVVREETLRKTAYHEGGHTLVAMLTKKAMPIYKTTILPRGHTAGVTYFLPEYKDEGNMTRSQIMAQLDVAMGGRVAEELIFGEDEVTTGAGSDMQKATQLARQFVMQFSMSKLGLTTYDRNAPPSPDTQATIDKEVNKLLTESYNRAMTLLTENRKQLDLLARALLKHETMTLEEMRLAVRGKTVVTKAEARKKAEDAAKKKATRKGGSLFGIFGKGNSSTEPSGGSAAVATAKSAPAAKSKAPTKDDDSETPKSGGRKWV